MPQSVRVEIQELNVAGFSLGAARRIADGAQRELHSIVAARGVPLAWIQARSIEAAHTGRVTVGPVTNPYAIGTQMARAVWSMPVGERR
jgi:hypothetical protein